MPRPSTRVIFLTLVLNVLAIGLILPALPSLIRTLVQDDVARAAMLFGLSGTLWAALQFFCAPALGALSDHLGRRPVILGAQAALLATYGLMAFVPGLLPLLAGRVLSGVAAGSFACASAYLADITPPGKRASGFGLLGAAFGIGLGLGPAIGGPLGALDPHLPFQVATLLLLGNLLLCQLCLAESLPPSQRIPFSWRRATPLGALRLLSQPELKRPALIALLSFLAIDALPSTLILFSGYRFGWHEIQGGLALSLLGLSLAAVQGLALPWVLRIAGDTRAIRLGLAVGGLGFVLYGTATAPWLLWIGTPIIAIGCGLIGPTVQALLAKAVASSRQGELQGAFHGLHGLSNMLSPVIFTQLFALGITAGQPTWAAGLPYFVAATLLVVGIAAWRAGDEPA